MFNRFALISYFLIFPVISLAAQAEEPVNLRFFEGNWTIYRHDGSVAGTSAIESRWPNAVYFEQRKIGDDPAQLLWFVNMETDGWQQLFIGIAGTVRKFQSVSETGKWPLVFALDVVLKDGTPARFRMTVEKQSEDVSRRILERSVDGGSSWGQVFDYTYRRN